MARKTDNQLLNSTRLWMMVDNTGFAIYRACELEFTRFDLTVEQSSILHILLDRGGSILMSLLMVETHCQPNSVYTLIDRMARAGLVAKEKVPGERTTLIRISEKGEQKYHSLTHKSLDLAFSPLSGQQKMQLAKLLIGLTVRARDILGLRYQPPLQQYLLGEENKRPPSILEDPLEDLSEPKLWAILNTARFTINRARQMELAKYGTTIEQLSVLFILQRERKPVNITQIIDDTMRQPASVYSLVNKMKKKGILKIDKQVHNATFTVTASPAGRKLFESVTAQSLDSIFADLSNQQKEQLGGILEILHRHMRKMLGIDYTPPLLRDL